MTTPHETNRGGLACTDEQQPVPIAPEILHIEALKTEIFEADRTPPRDYVAMGTQYLGLSTASICAARELPALGMAMTLISIGILAVKGIAAQADRSKIPEVVAIATVLLATVTLGFGDKFNPSPEPSIHVQQSRPK